MYSRSREKFCEKEIVKKFSKNANCLFTNRRLPFIMEQVKKFSEEKDESTREHTAESFVKSNKGFVFPFFRNFPYRKCIIVNLEKSVTFSTDFFHGMAHACAM